MAGGAPAGRTLEQTPTWAVAVICTMFVVVSLIGERTLHYLGHWLSKTKRKPLYEALEKMKEELMLLGFISLLITVTAESISKVCVRTTFFDGHLMPCSAAEAAGTTEPEHFLINRKLSEYFMDQVGLPRRSLAGAGNSCAEGKEPFISFLGLEQLHRFLFVMGCTHVFYSCLTMLLAVVKVYSWRRWEDEAHSHVDNQQNMAEFCRNLTMKRQSTFVQHHASTPGSRNPVIIWVICFFRQFGQSVTRPDYLALRLGFVTKHSTGPKYDFHSYMIRSMEDEFKEIVGISPLFWVFVVLFMLFNVDGSNLYFWMSFLPIVMVLIVGAKLQRIIAQLALENSGLSGPLDGVHLRPRDSLFWFRRPQLMMHLIHFILFQDAFELATFFWIWWQFGWDSCFMSKKSFAYIRVITGFLVQVLCSYSTLPLYALVTQMGSNYKKAIFQDNVVESLHHWKKVAKHRAKEGSSHAGSNDGQETFHHHHRESPPPPPIAEIELENEGGARHVRSTARYMRNIEKVPNVFTLPNDTLLSPKLPEYSPSVEQRNVEMIKPTYGRHNPAADAYDPNQQGRSME
ncbi:hypothetical protein SELMODRAFT_154277 [Selaginella moellendorffii]|uniref:MLO-like protein n=1 Tax=Selaginella moellendorffii TaxID=88036 RepID=D8SCM3_SELML|nr:MLO-like protein 14 [Selaginella moellendorffii]EFJ17882.1 hypothetical protein SELMODRAFT_154277 [Selaginella moellendorffii]|eukprot:XP_002981181.1 MLO-like protein 14 [Selaginella moellendorffii]